MNPAARGACAVAAAVAAIVVAAAALAHPASAQADGGGRTAAAFLRLPASARALALGGAYPAAGGDDAAIFYNPAQLAVVGRRAAGLSLQRYLEATTLGSFAAAARVGSGTAAVGLHALDYGGVDEIVADASGADGARTGRTISAADYALSLGYAVSRGRLRAGGAAKLIRQQLAGLSGSAWAADIGAAADLRPGMTVAIAARNLGGSLALGGVRAPLPSSLRVAASVPIVAAGAWSVVGTGELSRARQGSGEGAGGAEVVWNSSTRFAVIGRAGAAWRGSGDIASPLTVGGGIRTGFLALDYAYQALDGAPGSHRLGVRWWRG
ncbi:MAG: PorV/PorQ family protein [Gemmatimonadaceae bacterium]